MRILLTGASGMIGKRLQAALLAEGHHVVSATRTPPTPARAGLGWLHADFSTDTGQALWLARLTHIDVVINAVGIFRQTGTQTFARLHTDTPRALFGACAASDSVRLVIQLSALGADQHADTPYHLSKKAADDYLATLPLASYIVQPSLVFGRDGASARLCKTLASMPFMVKFGNGAQLVQPIHLDDAVAAIAALLRQPLPSGADGATARRIALVGPAPLSFTAYLRALRSSMGLGRLRVLALPAWAGRFAASLGMGLFDRDALRMLERGNSADPADTARLLGHAPRPPASFIDEPAAERTLAKLGWLLPPLRLSVALVWIATAIVSACFYPTALSLELLARTGVPAALGPLMLYGACALDLAFGLGILLLRRRRWLWRAQLALIGFYTLVIACMLPEFLIHPYGPLTKNLPLLAAIWLLSHCEER